MCNTQKRFSADRHHHCCVGDVFESTLECGCDSCSTCCRSCAAQEDDAGYLRHVAFRVFNRPAVRSNAVDSAAALLQCLQCLLEFFVMPIWRVHPAPPGCNCSKLFPLFHEIGDGISGRIFYLLQQQGYLRNRSRAARARGADGRHVQEEVAWLSHQPLLRCGYIRIYSVPSSTVIGSAFVNGRF